jgi:tetratricopeptide (TPR) repeat protein
MISKINLYSLGFILALFVLSCEKRLDVNPTQSIDELQALRTSSDVEAALVGAYADLGNADLYGGDLFVFSELLANDNGFNWTGTFQELTQIYNKAIPVDNAFVASTWLRAYQTINDVNNVLDALPVVVDARKNSIEGEAKFIRGSLYFELVRLYAKAWNDGDPATNDGVPIVLTPTRAPLNETAQLPRDKVAAVYAQAIKDLTEAEALLPTDNGVFANSYAAAAMLARIYLQQGDYTNAAAAADRVISSGTYELEQTYAAVFPFNQSNLNEDVDSPGEYIFSMQVTSSQGVNDFNTYFSPYGRGDIDIREEHLEFYEAGDDRLNLFYDDGGIFRTGKFDMVYGNVPVIRLAEMYLVRAEANFRMNTSVGADPVDDINLIRERVGLPAYSGGELTLEKIIMERRVELAFEGQNLHDIKRLQGSVGTFPWDSPKLIFPIPSREIKVNPNLTQNEGY